MSGLREVVGHYLSLRRALGYKLEREGMLLPDFVAFVEDQGSQHITTELALRWACQPLGASSYWWARRLGMVRRFAVHVRALDPRTEVPATDLIGYRKPRRTPYLYTDADVQAVMRECARLRGPLASATYATLFGLLAVTGMRVGEAIALDRSDVDEHHQLLVIRHSKFNKSREVPLHASTIEALQVYSGKRDRRRRRAKSPSFFVSHAGTRLWAQNVWERFSRLRRWARLPSRPRPPCIHDLRHSFAVATLLRWYREGDDVEAKLPLLSTYLGHVSPSTTYWYLTAAPELLGLAAQRLERAWGDRP
jgi:integrase